MRKLETEVHVNFLSLCCREKDRESESAKREQGDQKPTAMERLRNSG